MSDRLAVMAGGRIEQVGPPTELYEAPATTYVAGFLGVANLFPATARGGDGGGCRLRLGEFDLEATGGDTAATGDVRVVIRPERVRLEDDGTTGPNRVPGMVERLVYQGPATQLVVRLANGESLQGLAQNQGQPLSWQQGTAIAVHLPPTPCGSCPRRAKGPNAGRCGCRLPGDPPVSGSSAARSGCRLGDGRPVLGGPGEAELLGAGVHAQVEHAVAGHLGVAQHDQDGQPVDEGGQPQGEGVDVDRGELAAGLALADDLADGGPPAPVHGQPIAGHVGVAGGPGPQVQPQHPLVEVFLGLPHRARAAHQLDQPIAGAGHLGHRVGGLGVEPLLGEGQRLGQQDVLLAEVVDHQGRAGPGLVGHVLDAGVAEAFVRDHLHGRLEDLPTSRVGKLSSWAHACSKDLGVEVQYGLPGSSLASPHFRLNVQSITSGGVMSWDAIVIGGGHNGLVAGAYLARAGARTVVLEARSKTGGAAATDAPWPEAPDIKVTRLSYVMSLMPPRIIRDLELERHGYKLYPMGPAYQAWPDGRSLTIYEDAARRNHEQISRFSSKDAEAMTRWDAWLEGLAAVLGSLLTQTPPKLGSRRLSDLADLLRLAWRYRGLDVRTVGDVTRLMTMSVSDLLDDWFESEEVKATLAINGVIGTWAGPESPGTAYVMAHHSIGDVGDGHLGSWGFPEGGMGAVADAIHRSALANGASVRTGARVERVAGL